jgi:hypothetical protein
VVDSVSGLGVVDREEDEGAVGSGGRGGCRPLELEPEVRSGLGDRGTGST